MKGRKFYLDRRNGKAMGVCAGLSEYTGVDVTWVRVAMVLLTLAAFPWAPLFYLVLGMVASKRPEGFYEEDDLAALRSGKARGARAVRSSTADVRESMRDIDRRMLEVDSFVAGSSSRLAQDIEQLR
jgi:phage shock protein C